MAAWHAVTGTPWTAYKLAIASNESAYYLSLAQAHGSHEAILASATQTESVAVSNAQWTFSREIPQVTWQASHDRAEAKSDFWTNSSEAMRVADVAAANERQTIRDDLAEAYHARSVKSADDGYQHAMARSDAYHSYTMDIADARVLEFGPNYCSSNNQGGYGYGYGWGWGWWGYYGYVPASSAASLWNALNKALNNASHDLQIANIDTNETWTQNTRSLLDSYQNNIHTASEIKSNELAGDLKLYHETTAMIDRNFAIDSMVLEGDLSQAKAAAHTTYVQTTAPADQSYTYTTTVLQGNRSVSDAGTLKSYRVNEATSYAAAVNAWSSVVNSPWSSMHALQGTIEVNWANASGNAEIAYSQTMRSVESARTHDRTVLERDRSTNTVVANQIRADEIADARDAYLALASEARYQHALVMAGVVFDRTENANNQSSESRQGDRDNNSSLITSSAAAESQYQRSMASAWREYRNSASDARTSLWSTAGTASQNYWRGDMSYESYVNTVQNAYDNYNSAMSPVFSTFDSLAHSAWDALRNARADALAASSAYTAQRTTRHASLTASGNEALLSHTEGDSRIAMAAAIRSATIDLATALRGIEVTYATTIATLDASVKMSTASIDAGYDIAANLAAAIKNRNTFIAGAARREDQISIRGLYESALYQQHALAKQSVAATIGTNLATFQFAVSMADATYAEALRIARDGYEDAVSFADLAHLDSVNTANAIHISTTNNASISYAQATANAEKTRTITLATANANHHLANVTADALFTELEIARNVEYNNAVADALYELQDAMTDLSTGYSLDIGAAWKQYYLDSTSQWYSMSWGGIDWWGYGGWYGGWYDSWYGGYYGWGYAGYVYGGYGGGYSWLGGGWGSGGYDWYGWGYGYGWGWGFGWGGWFSGNSDSWNDLQGTIEDHNDAYNVSADDEELAYVEAVGEAQTQRTTQFGDGQIALATARGSAEVDYASAINNAETAYGSATNTARANYETTTANANKTRADAIATADRIRIVSRENSTLALRNFEATAAVIQTSSTASAEVVYQQTDSHAQAVFLASLASTSGSPELFYKASYASARADWIAAVSTAYVAHASSEATSAGQLAYNLALARKNREVTRAQADEVFAKEVAALGLARAIGAVNPTQVYQTSLVGLESSRRLNSAQNTKAYEIAIATGEKQLAIDTADAQKQFYVDGINDVDEQERDHNRRKAIADAVFANASSAADAAKAWQDAEVHDRSTLTTLEANIQTVYSQAQASLQYDHDSLIAAATFTRDITKANAEGNFWSAENGARNTQRTSLANAEIAWRHAQETARVDAHSAINDDLQLPWTAFLVDAAIAQRSAWLAVSTRYVLVTNLRNMIETITYTNRLTAAYKTREKTLVTAEKTHSNAAASVQRDTNQSRANSIRDYLFDLAAPATNYANSVTQAEYVHTMAVAQANKDFVYHEDTSVRDQQIQAADNALEITMRTTEQNWYGAEAVAQSGKFLDFATIERDGSLSSIAADVALANAKSNAEKAYRNAETLAYRQSAGAWANVDNMNRQFEAGALSAAYADLAHNSPSPWTLQAAADYAARAVFTATSGEALKTQITNQAIAQWIAETAQTDSEAAWKTAYATANGIYRQAVVMADWALAGVQASAIAALGGSGIYRTDLPSPSTPVDLTGEHDIAPAPSSHYDARIIEITNSSSGYVVYGWYWGSWGYYGLGYWSSDGYWINDSWLASTTSDVTLIHAAEQFPSSFWDAKTPADAVSDRTDSYDGDVYQLNSDIETLLVPKEPHASINVIPFTTSVVGLSTQETLGAEEIADQLEPDNPDLADMVRQDGLVAGQHALERPVPSNPMPVPLETQTPSLDNSGVETAAFNDRFYITVPSEWNVVPTALALQQAARGDGSSLQNGSGIRQRFLRHVDERTPGFEIRQTGMFAGVNVSYNRPDSVVILNNSDVYWRSYKSESFFGGSGGISYIDTKIGVTTPNGWVRLLSGERATLSSLQRWSGAFTRASNQDINATLDAVISPFYVDPTSSQMGIFIGGTGMHFFGLGNVERMYNLYEGSKFYYGGVGNPIDFEPSANFWAAGGAGLGWTQILDRAVADIRIFHQPGQQIHIFGWSRGAAMANELAARLGQSGIHVAFVGMFDPVYSVGLPGQDSLDTDAKRWPGFFGNYVTAPIAGNVHAAAAIYAINEDRSFFPATRFRHQTGTRLITMKSPGAHGEIGGSFGSNMNMQQLNLKAMIEFAREYGKASFRFRGIEDDAARIIASPVTRFVVLNEADEKTRTKALIDWDRATAFEHWSPFSLGEFTRQLESQNEDDWWPGAFGFQKSQGWSIAAATISWAVRLLRRDFNTPPQPFDGHYQRDLDWVDREIWEIGLRGSNGNVLALSEEAKQFIRDLYERQIDPYRGGWMGVAQP